MPFDALPLDQYKANYAAIIHGKPMPYGNMKGKVLDRELFRRDYDDFDLLLRKNVPAKYALYFKGDKPYNLSPVKKTKPKIPSVNVKDSQDLQSHQPLKQNLFKSDEDLDSDEEPSYNYLVAETTDRSGLSELVNGLVRKLHRLEGENRALRKISEEQVEREKLETKKRAKVAMDEREKTGMKSIELVRQFQLKLAKYKRENEKYRRENENLEANLSILKNEYRKLERLYYENQGLDREERATAASAPAPTTAPVAPQPATVPAPIAPVPTVTATSQPAAPSIPVFPEELPDKIAARVVEEMKKMQLKSEPAKQAEPIRQAEPIKQTQIKPAIQPSSTPTREPLAKNCPVCQEPADLLDVILGSNLSAKQKRTMIDQINPRSRSSSVSWVDSELASPQTSRVW